jgi:chemotaxis protein methyltransferase CheR
VLGSYETFKESILELTNIDLNSYKERQMKRRIDSLITKHGISSYTNYVEILRTKIEFYNEFINHITINVSEFYRNPEQWKVLESEIIPFLLDIFGNKLKIWSAACSTGDEPYSLVMLLSKFMPLSDIKVLATDIDKLVLEKARIGIYHQKSLKGLPLEYINKYFVQLDDKTYKISDDIKACVELKQHDLLKDPYPADCSLIVCRNVLIYFTDEAKTRIYNGFRQALMKNGVLFVGSTEQMLHANKLGFVSLKSFFYIKQ